MRYVRFWLLSNGRTGELTAIRGQYGKTGEDPALYEIFKRDDGWHCLKWLHLKTDPDAHAFEEIAIGPDCFTCMAAAENDAQQQEEAMLDDESEDDE